MFAQLIHSRMALLALLMFAGFCAVVVGLQTWRLAGERRRWTTHVGSSVFVLLGACLAYLAGTLLTNSPLL